MARRLAEDGLKIAPPAVPALDGRAEAGSEARLFVELGAALRCHCSVELRPSDEAEPDEELAQALARLCLGPQSLVESAAVNRSLGHENRP